MSGIKLKEGEARLIGIIGDEETVTGMLLAGVGDTRKAAEYGPNYKVVTRDGLSLEELESTFLNMTNRPDIIVVLITQTVANEVRHLIVNHTNTKTIPAVLEIPSKDVPYDANDDTILRKVNIALGSGDVTKKKK
eukprot:TRINITY_DN3691_c2_g1_i1.p1 TRINITY_DN3691_c2_g1~~TRINITY_DN3691_c2_g1_i1.p1  ORF type:complete len:135 (+),score=36.18 TRINITY_DN3691_c2_g1_i1:46-450(+)